MNESPIHGTVEPGFEAESIDKARIAVRADFFGHRFTKWLAAQVTYMRPGVFVKYNNVNGPAARRRCRTPTPA